MRWRIKVRVKSSAANMIRTCLRQHVQAHTMITLIRQFKRKGSFYTLYVHHMMFVVATIQQWWRVTGPRMKAQLELLLAEWEQEEFDMKEEDRLAREMKKREREGLEQAKQKAQQLQVSVASKKLASVTKYATGFCDVISDCLERQNYNEK